MDNIHDPFPSSLPTYDPPVRIFDQDATMTQAGDGGSSFLNSPNAPFGDAVDNYTAATRSKSSHQDASMLATVSGPKFYQSHSPESSVQNSSTDSKRNSTDGSLGSSKSDGNGGDVDLAEDDTPAPNGIIIGADPVDDGNNFFDFDSAASSPSMPDPKFYSKTCQNNRMSMPYRSFQTHGYANGVGPYAGASRSSREASPMLGSKRNEQSRPLLTSHTSPEFDEKFINCPMLDERFYQYRSPPPDPLATGVTQPSRYPNLTSSVSYAYPTIQNQQEISRLYIDPLPPKSRVETQIPVKLTLVSPPPGIETLHLQTHTVGKSKLVAKDPPKRAAHMLELHVTLTCTSAMQDIGRRDKALNRARAAGRPSSPVAEEDKALDVQICQGCIERERKRAARKKLKNADEEEIWQKDEAKRAIVFNAQEVREWQRPIMPKHGEAGNQGMEYGMPPYPEGTMQMDLLMRIACYCRHQEEKTGFQVIFTIKDHRGTVIAQELSNSIIITDDHKTHGGPAAVTPHNGSLSEQHQLTGSSKYPQIFGVGNSQGFNIGSNRALSANDLVGMPNRNVWQTSNQSNSFANSQNPSQATSAMLTSRNLSRQASPSGPSSAVQNKRRKGSGSRMRNDLMMTQLQSTPPHHPSHATSSSTEQALPFGPDYASPHGLPLNSLHSHYNTNPPTPSTTDSSFFSSAQRSQSLENLPHFRGIFSAPISVQPSRAPSPIAPAPQTNAISQVHAQRLATSIHAAPDLTHSQPVLPVIHKLTPAEGPKSGGIEVTCLGAGFRKDLDVVFGDVLATTTTFWGESALVCLVPPAVQAGLVPVHLRHNNNHDHAPPPSKQVFFRYIDDNEQELMRQALQVLNQQWTDDPTSVGHFARQMLSYSNNQSFQRGSTHTPNNPNWNTTSDDHTVGSLDLELTVLRCLEILDLDDAPYQRGLNFRGDNGQGMLHLSASMGFYRLVCGLLARGAHPDLRDCNGLSPLHMACLHEQTAIIRKLRSAGADPTLRSLNGKTPTDMNTSKEVWDAINIFDQQTHQKSIGANSTSRISRTSSQRSVDSVRCMNLISATSGMMDRSNEVGKSIKGDSSGYKSKCMTPSQMWARSRRNSLIAVDNISEHPHANTSSSDTSAFASSPAMSAWRDQLSAQIQQLQQSVHRALPPIPALPDYQAYPVVRRISSLVPHRSLRPGSSHDTGGVKEADYHWWELLTGATPLPPAYEEIYPQESQERTEEKKMATMRAAGETLLDQKCEALYDQPGSSTRSKVASQEEQGRVDQQPEQSETARAQKVKRLRSDRRLFFIWIPLLVLVIVAMMKDSVSYLWQIARFALTNHDHGEALDVS